MESNKELHELKPPNVSDYIKTITLLGLPLSLVMGSVYLSSYYSAFYINVFEFISIADILILSLEQLILLAVGLFLVLVLDNQNSAKLKFRIYTALVFAIVASVSLRIFRGDTFISMMEAATSFLITFIPPSIFIIFFAILLIIYIVIVIGAKDSIRRLESEWHIPFNAFAVIGVYAIFLIALYVSGKYDAYKVKSDVTKHYYMATIIDPIKENENFRFIGAAGSHFFVWDSDLEQTHILRLDSVNHLAIGSK